MAVDISSLKIALNFNGNFNDSSGNGYHGTAVGATIASSSPMVAGTPYSIYRGGDDYVSVPAPASILDATSGTLVFWCRVSSVSSMLRLFSISQNGVAYPTCDEWGISFRGDSSKELQLHTINGAAITMSCKTPDNVITSTSTPYMILVSGVSGDAEPRVKINNVVQSMTAYSPYSKVFKWLGDAADANCMTLSGVRREIFYGTDADIDAFYYFSDVLNTETEDFLWNGGAGRELGASRAHLQVFDI